MFPCVFSYCVKENQNKFSSEFVGKAVEKDKHFNFVFKTWVKIRVGISKYFNYKFSIAALCQKKMLLPYFLFLNLFFNSRRHLLSGVLNSRKPFMEHFLIIRKIFPSLPYPYIISPMGIPIAFQLFFTTFLRQFL